MKTNKLTVTLHIGDKQVETLTEAQRDKISEKLSDAMSVYYTAHPGEYLKIKEE